MMIDNSRKVKIVNTSILGVIFSLMAIWLTLFYNLVYLEEDGDKVIVAYPIMGILLIGLVISIVYLNNWRNKLIKNLTS